MLKFTKKDSRLVLFLHIYSGFVVSMNRTSYSYMVPLSSTKKKFERSQRGFEGNCDKFIYWLAGKILESI